MDLPCCYFYYGMGHGLRGDSAVKLRPAVFCAPWDCGVRSTYRACRWWLSGERYADDGAFMAGFTVLSGKPGLALALRRHGDSRPKRLFVLLSSAHF